MNKILIITIIGVIVIILLFALYGDCITGSGMDNRTIWNHMFF